MRHAEKIEWNEQGDKTVQIRTGEYAIGYWFGMKHYEVISEPNYFGTSMDDGWARSDPNSIRAIGSVGKSVFTEVIIP